MLHVQKFLREGGSLEDLTRIYAIDVKRHSEYTGLVLLKYDQINSDFSVPIVKECRGIVLDSSDNWNVVCYSMRKFHNFGEPLADHIDWNTALVYTKEDGSLIQIFPYDNKWLVATSGSFGDGPVGDYGFTFRDLWLKTFTHKLPSTNCGCSFFFELCSVYNKIVVRHLEPHVVLLGGRNLATLKELTLEEAHAYFPECKKVDSHPFTSFDECIAASNKVSALEREGFVVCDKDFNRVKLKSLEYVHLHHLKSSLGNSRRALIQVVLKSEIPEIVASFPEFSPILLEAKSRLDALVIELETLYNEVSSIETQKEFALEIIGRKCKCTSALFAVRAKKAKNIRSYLCDMTIDSVVELLGYRTEK